MPIAFGILLALAAPVLGEPQIAVRVYDYSQVPEATLRKAQARAAYVFQKIGVEVRWVDHTNSGTVILNLNPRAMEPLCSRSDSELGLALLSDTTPFARFAYVFVHRVEELSKWSGCSLPILVGCAMAHEIGHLLLGNQSHGKWGLMKASWKSNELRRAATGALGFTTKEADRIRTQVERRLGSSRPAALALR